MKRFLSVLAIFATVSISVGAQEVATSVKKAPAVSYAQKYVDAIASSKDLSTSSFGVLAVTVGGDTIAKRNHRIKLLPASSTKVVSTGLAISTLGSDYTIRTSVGYTGSIRDGVLKGDLYIVGGGDPTLFCEDSIATPREKVFKDWMKFLSDKGIRKIDGRIVGDGRFFEGYADSPSWCYEDIGTYYGTGGDALSFCRNTVLIGVKAGSYVGAPVSCIVTAPSLPWMDWRYSCTTGEKGTGDELYLYASDIVPVAEMKGTFAIDRAPKTEECSNKFGAYTVAYYFREYLTGHGVEVTGKPADIDRNAYLRDIPGGKPLDKAAPSSKINIIGSTASPSIKRIAYITNHRSDNFYADALMRLTAKRLTGSASFESIPKAVRKACEKIGVDASEGIHIVDGSGLSRKDYISPDFFCRYLRGMMKNSGKYNEFRYTLGYPGEASSYPYRLRGESASLRSRIRMKSGSMGGVYSFNGYVEPQSGKAEDTIVFSIIVNNFDGNYSTLLSQLDKVIALIASSN